VLFFAILMVFPLYLKLFPPNQAYAVFGIFLVLTFWLYLLGIVFVLGAELNAFLQEPSRSVALAEATQQAQRGKATYNQQTGQVQAATRGTAPALSGTEGSPAEQMARNDQTDEGEQPARRGILGRPLQQPRTDAMEPTRAPSGQEVPARGGFGSRLAGVVALIVAALLLRGRTIPDEERARS
jgi:hypothetical protein